MTKAQRIDRLALRIFQQTQGAPMIGVKTLSRSEIRRTVGKSVNRKVEIRETERRARQAIKKAVKRLKCPK